MTKIRFGILLLTISLLFSCSKQEELISEPIRDAGSVERIIYLIGDGMGVAQINALMIARNNADLIFSKSKVSGYLTTNSSNNRITDSAAAGTALACGHKTNNGMLGQLPNGKKLKSILKYAQEKQWRTGLIVTCELTNATPAAFYSNVDSRTKEGIIADHLADSGINVIIGGGISNNGDALFLDSIRKKFSDKGYAALSDAAEIDLVDTENYTLFLKEKGCLPTIQSGRDMNLMTGITESVLNGFGNEPFFLMIEGSQIDMEAHSNNIKGVIGEMHDFENIVRVCYEYADRTPGTLVVVTADHETGGLSITNGSNDFLTITNVEFNFSSNYHTDVMVPIYAYGAGASAFSGIYDNTLVMQKMMALLGW